MFTITDIKDFIKDQFDGTQKQFHYKHESCQEISNPDESYLCILNIIFSDYPDDDDDADIYIEESQSIETKILEFIYFNWDEQCILEELNQNSHYIANSNGNTISVHFNDTSAFIIITLTGQN